MMVGLFFSMMMFLLSLSSAAVFGDVDAVSTDTDNLITSAASEKVKGHCGCFEKM